MLSSNPNPSGKPATPVFHKVGENLYRHASGTYYALLKRGGKQFRRSLKCSDRKLADRRLAALRERVGKLTLSDDAKAGFEDAARSWMKTTRPPKESSVIRRETCIKNLTPFFKGRPLKGITATHCEEWQTGRGRDIAPQTFAHELNVMRAVFDFAVQKGWMLDNPAAHIKRKKITQAKIDVPTREQFQKLVAAIRQSDGREDSQRKAKPGADLIELLAYSGCRLAEATALRWSEVSLERNCITITGGEVGTKNHESRTVPMTEALRGLLLRLKAEGEWQPLDRVARVGDAKTTLRKTCAKLGFPVFTHHDFRHFFATTCIESGVDIPTISKWLGHKDGGALAMKVYGHLRQEHSFIMIRRVNFGTAAAENLVTLETAAVS